MRFDTMEDFVGHIHGSHVYQQDGIYLCRWDGCLRGNKGFNARYKMTIHLRTHTLEKPYVCENCSKRFSRQENLRIHFRTHTGEKPYKCNAKGCDKMYSNSSDRFKHSRTHEDDRPYFCKFPNCPKRYTDPSSLRKHVKMYSHSVNQINFSPSQQSLSSFNRPQSISPDSSGSSSSLGASPTLLTPPTIHPAFHQTENTVNRGITAENYEAIGRAFASQYAQLRPRRNLVFGGDRPQASSVDPMAMASDSSRYAPIDTRANLPSQSYDEQQNPEIDVVGESHNDRLGRVEAADNPFPMEVDQNSPNQFHPRMGEALALLYPSGFNQDEANASSLPLDLSMPSARRRRRRDQRDPGYGNFSWMKQYPEQNR